MTSGELPPSRAARRAAEAADSPPAHHRNLAATIKQAARVARTALRTRGSRSAGAPAAGSDAGGGARAAGSSRRTARVAATVLVVPAIVGTVALPAYALVPGTPGFGVSDAFSRTQAEAQDVDVSANASGGARTSDAYAVHTKAEIDAEAARAAAAAASERSVWGTSVGERPGAYSTPTQQAEGDDYPWWYETPDDYGGGLSPLRYYYRECVDFVAWRLNRDAGVTSAPWKWDWSNLASGSAYAWADEWARRGWATSSTPIVGSVAWFPYNHVAYVQAVNADGTVTIEEYNQNSDHSYHVRTIPVSGALYLYPPV